jgi:hypothetical protein
MSQESLRTTTRVAAVLVASAVLAIAASTQAAGGKVITSRFDIAVYSERVHPFRLSVFGRVRSREPRCYHHRTVTLYFRRGDKRHLRDADRSSHNGGVWLHGRSRGVPERFIVKVAKKRFDTHGRTVTCWPARKSVRLR